jgi:hypothetical protein
LGAAAQTVLASEQALGTHIFTHLQTTILFSLGSLPMVLYGCETWSLTLREEHRLRVSENRVLRRIFGPKRDEVTG